jgi:hypothetical protein
MNQRKEPRRGYFARIVVAYLDHAGSEIEIQGMIEDRSESGLGLRLSKPLLPGCQVRVRHGARVYVGVVRRCLKSSADYLVGIVLERNPDRTVNEADTPSASSSQAR